MCAPRRIPIPYHDISRKGRLRATLFDLPWSIHQVITYSSHHVYNNLTEEQKGRVAFASNFLAGDASLQIEPLKPSDEGRYTCKVKNSGRYVWSHVTLKVLGKIRVPRYMPTFH